MLRWLIASWGANVLVLGVATWALAGVRNDGSAWTLIWAALVFGILNTILKPVLKVVTFPLALLTLGIAWFFVSMLMLWLTDVLVPRWDIDGFWNYVGATLIVWAVNMVVDALLRRDRTTPGRALVGR